MLAQCTGKMQGTMRVPELQFDIFSGHFDGDAVWIECVTGLAKARERMGQIAAKKPGHYFLFSVANQFILAQVDSSGRPKVGSLATL